ncbi:hypothetical protein ACFV3R_32960 [Streptomyces sp. NPDC059740]|uniref:hypothetical protein n=1 Tax=Streptomyces sp. NPDC059740 TaxID=3346926 RepID=UPI00365D2532
MHRVESKQTYTTCRGGATSVYPETVVVDEYEPGSRSVRVHDADRSGPQYDIPVSYFHETAHTRQGTRRKTGYYLVRS